MSGRQQADYVIKKNRTTGEWDLSWRRNPPIHHYTYAEAVATLKDLLRLEITWKSNKRGNERN